MHILMRYETYISTYLLDIDWIVGRNVVSAGHPEYTKKNADLEPTLDLEWSQRKKLI